MTTTSRRSYGRTTARGYGWRHQEIRAQVAKRVAAGTAICSRCHKPIHPSQPWDLDHADGIDKRLGVYRGPSHRSCNRAGKRARRQQPKRPRALDYFDIDTSKISNETDSGRTRSGA